MTRSKAGAGADRLTGGTGNDQFVLAKGEIAGDVITDFKGNGALAGDTLRFTGFGAGSTLAAQRCRSGDALLRP